MIRLLLRLFVQRIREYRSNRTIHRQQSAKDIPTSGKRFRLRFWVATGVIAVIAASFAISYRIQNESILLDTNAELARLTVTLDTINNSPYVIFLESLQPLSNVVPENTNVSRILIKNNQFIPTLQILPAGSTLEIENQDSFLHNAHVTDGENTVFNVATPLKSVTVSKILKATGMLNVRCDLHPSMHSWIFVPPSPHFAVLEKPETLTWRNIQPGRYDLRVWNVGVISQSTPISLPPGSKKSVDISL